MAKKRGARGKGKAARGATAPGNNARKQTAAGTSKEAARPNQQSEAEAAAAAVVVVAEPAQAASNNNNNNNKAPYFDVDSEEIDTKSTSKKYRKGGTRKALSREEWKKLKKNRKKNKKKYPKRHKLEVKEVQSGVVVGRDGGGDDGQRQGGKGRAAPNKGVDDQEVAAAAAAAAGGRRPVKKMTRFIVPGSEAAAGNEENDDNGGGTRRQLPQQQQQPMTPRPAAGARITSASGEVGGLPPLASGAGEEIVYIRVSSGSSSGGGSSSSSRQSSIGVARGEKRKRPQGDGNDRAGREADGPEQEDGTYTTIAEPYYNQAEDADGESSPSPPPPPIRRKKVKVYNGVDVEATYFEGGPPKRRRVTAPEAEEEKRIRPSQRTEARGRHLPPAAEEIEPVINNPVPTLNDQPRITEPGPQRQSTNRKAVRQSSQKTTAQDVEQTKRLGSDIGQPRARRNSLLEATNELLNAVQLDEEELPTNVPSRDPDPPTKPSLPTQRPKRTRPVSDSDDGPATKKTKRSPEALFLHQTKEKLKRLVIPQRSARYMKVRTMLGFLRNMKLWTDGDAHSISDVDAARTFIDRTPSIDVPVFVKSGCNFSLIDQGSKKRPIDQMLDHLTNPDEKWAHDNDQKPSSSGREYASISEIRKRFRASRIKRQDYPWNFPDISNPFFDRSMPRWMQTPNSTMLSDLMRRQLDMDPELNPVCYCKGQDLYGLDVCSEGHTITDQELHGLQSVWSLWQGTVMLAEIGALTLPHWDRYGLATWISSVEGAIGLAWLVRPSMEDWIGWIKDEWNPRAGRWVYRVLRPGDSVYLPPGTVHLVFRHQDRDQTLAFAGHVVRWTDTVQWLRTLLTEMHTFLDVGCDTPFVDVVPGLMRSMKAMLEKVQDGEDSEGIAERFQDEDIVQKGIQLVNAIEEQVNRWREQEIDRKTPAPPSPQMRNGK